MLKVEGAENVRPPQPISITAISADYFRVMRTSLVKGRVFTESDAQGAQGVVIINQSLERMVFNARDPLGQHVSFGPTPASWMEVVGVIRDARDSSLEREPGPEIFVPYLQQPSFSMTFMLRTGLDPETLAGAVRKAVESVDKNQPLSDVKAMDQVVANSAAPRRFRMLLLGQFALIALVLAAVGIYGVIAYSCSRRTHEFAIRLALGAERSDILKIVIRQGVSVALSGVCIGVVGAFALTRFIASLLYGVKPTDPETFVGVSLLLIGVALLASYIPARRATKVDPMVALRYE
jgi:putative ABC transport system permease protein